MKKTLFYIMVVCLFAPISFGTYTYTITEYQVLPDLSGTESMLISGQGGGGLLELEDFSFVTIQSTSTLVEGMGGVWEIDLSNNSFLNMSGGQVHEIVINNYATTRLSGGLIQQIWSYQDASSGPHITVVYSGNLPAVQNVNGYPVLVGNWGDGSAFSIYLPNISGYSPAIENIRFELIPEPAMLVLLGLGGLMLRRK